MIKKIMGYLVNGIASTNRRLPQAYNDLVRKWGVLMVTYYDKYFLRENIMLLRAYLFYVG